MISSSLSIKILGVAVAGFLTIGVPAIVGIKKEEAARQEKETVLQGLFPGKSIEEAFKGETFSEQLFEDWNPDEQQQKYIATNWQKIIPRMPIKFFEPYSSIITTKLILTNPNTCYLQTNYFTNEAETDIQKLKLINIPFLKDKFTDKFKNTLKDKKPSLSREYKNRFWKLTQEEQQEINKSDNADISLLDDLYDETSKHFQKLDMSMSPKQSGLPIWFFNSVTCSDD